MLCAKAVLCVIAWAADVYTIDAHLIIFKGAEEEEEEEVEETETEGVGIVVD